MSTLHVVVPVRFSGGGLSMQTTTSRLGLDTAFIRCLVAPKEGSEITLWLRLPGISAPVQLKGAVTERVAGGAQGREAGFALRFGGMAPGAREHLVGFLRNRGASVPVPQPPKTAARPIKTPVQTQRRAFPRVAAKFQVRWGSAREFLVAYSENISVGGIFIATPEPPQLRETVELMLDLPDGKGPVKTQAEVVQRVTAEEARNTGRMAGAGLQFIGSDDEFRKRLDSCIEHLLNEKA